MSNYTDTILLEANRKSSVEFLGGNFNSPEVWNNDLGSGIKLDIGDQISVESGYISEIGNEESTIEVTGKKAINNKGETQRYTTQNVSLVKIQDEENNQNDYDAVTNPDASENLSSKEGNYSWTFTQDPPVVNDIQDDEINMTHSYYKSSQGDNYITLPRRCSSDDIQGWYQSGYPWAEYNSSANGSVAKENPYRIGTDYSDTRYFGNDEGWGYNLKNGATTTRTELANDGSKYTLFVRKQIKNYVPAGQKTSFSLDGQRDPALMDYIWYKRTVKYKVTKGFNSPANVATQFTNEMSNVTKITQVSYGEEDDGLDQNIDGQTSQNNINLEAQSNTYEPLPVATAWFIRSAAEMYFKNDYSNSVRFENLICSQPEGSRNFEYFARTNQFKIGTGFGGPPVSPDAHSGTDIFETRRLVPGYKFDRLITTTGDAAVQAIALISTPGVNGAFVTSVRDTTSSVAPAPGDQSYWAASREITTNTGVGNVGNDFFSFKFTNEHLPSWYESSFSTIGYKRPELQETGRDLMIDPDIKTGVARQTIDGSFTTIAMTYPLSGVQANGSSSTIFTKIPWNDSNLLKLRTFFDRQKLYPECFDYSAMSASQKELITTIDPATAKDNYGANVNLNKMRWIHMNDKHQGESISLQKTFTSWTSTYDGGYLTLNNTTGLKAGQRIWFSDDDVDDTRSFVPETFILNISATKVYVSSDYKGTLLSGIDSIYFASPGLGSDNYYDTTAAGHVVNVKDTHASAALFIDFNPDRINIAEGYGNEISVWESLSYGFAKKIFFDDKEYIGFSVRNQQFGEIPELWFDGGSISSERSIGFDKHFNAFGTAAILLSNGFAGLWGGEYSADSVDGDPYATAGDLPATSAPHYVGKPQLLPVPKTAGKVFKTFQNQPNADGYYIFGGIDPVNGGPITDDDCLDFRFGPQLPCSPQWAILYNELYCGANQPSLQFDSESSRFSFVQLHTSELVGTNSESSASATVIADAGAPVYKLNKRLSRLNYSSNFIPYNNVFKVTTAAQASGVSPEKDANITPYSIMDAQGGMFIEDYGCDEANWEQSLWALMGFTYDQFHQGGTRLTRMTDTGITTSTPTTNALIKTEDLSNFVTTGISSIPVKNTLQIGYPSWIFENGSDVLPSFKAGSAGPPVVQNDPQGLGDIAFNTGSHLPFPGYLSYPPISQSAVSTSIIAENLPRKMLSPIFLIKTDLLNPMYIGGREGTVALPVIGVVDKSSGYGDYFFGAKNSTIFTNTIPRTVQNITTSIVNADGRAARVDDASCIIYKIQKPMKSNSMVLENLINPPKK